MSLKLVTETDSIYRLEARKFLKFVEEKIDEIQQHRAEQHNILVKNWENRSSTPSSSRRYLNLTKEALSEHLSAKAERALSDRQCAILGKIRKYVRAGISRGDSFHVEKLCGTLVKIGKYFGTSAYYYRVPSKCIVVAASEACKKFPLLFPRNFAAEAFETEQLAHQIVMEKINKRKEETRIEKAARHKLYDKILAKKFLQADELSLLKRALIET